MNNSQFIDRAGMVVIIAGIIVAFFTGTQLNVLPGGVIDDAVAHPFRWWYAGGIFMITTIFGMILIAISSVIEELEKHNEREQEKADKLPSKESK